MGTVPGTRGSECPWFLVVYGQSVTLALEVRFLELGVPSVRGFPVYGESVTLALGPCLGMGPGLFFWPFFGVTD